MAVVAALVVFVVSLWCLPQQAGAQAPSALPGCIDGSWTLAAPNPGGFSRCYKYINAASLSWSGWLSGCATYAGAGSTLAVFQSQQEFDVVQALCPGSDAPDVTGWCWTGLYATAATTDPACACWKFADNSNANWLRTAPASWFPGEPNHADSSETCGMIGWSTAKLLNDFNCASTMFAVCSINAVLSYPSWSPTSSVSPSSTTSPTSTPTPTPYTSLTPTPSTSSTPSSSSTPSTSLTPTPSSSSTSTPLPTPSSSLTPSPSTSPTSSVTPTASASLTPTHTVTPTPSSSPTTSSTPSSSVTLTPSPFLSASPTSSTTPSSTSSLTPTPSPSSSATPSPSATPVFSQLEDNVGAAINPQQPQVNITVPEAVGDSSGPTVGVRSSFQELQVGSNAASNLGAAAVRMENRTSPSDASDTVATYIYSTVLPGSTTTFEQSFAFHKSASQGQFAQVGFAIGAGTLKWSINFTGSANAQSLTVRYRLSALTSSSESTAAAINTSATITRSSSTPAANMTTYSFPLVATSESASRQLAARVVVFDVAVVDGSLRPLVSHGVALVNESSSPAALPEYVLTLTFPAFASSLFYDPSINLGVLLTSSRSGSSGSTDTSGVYIGVGVAVPLAVLLVIAVIGVTYLIRRKQRRRAVTRIKKTLYDFNMTVMPTYEPPAG